MDRASTTEIERALSSLTVEKCKCDACGDSGYLWDEINHRIIGPCECSGQKRAEALTTWKREETRRLKSILLPKINLVDTKKKPWYPKLPEHGGVWLSGPADAGKTHAVGWMLAKKIDQATRPFAWAWFGARQVLEAWSGQYSEDWESRDKARGVMQALATASVIVLNDIDKIGKVTQAREEHFFDLFDSIHSRDAELLVPSNVTIDEFCRRMDNEDMFIRRDGIGPMQRRLKEVCKEIKLNGE